MTDKLKGAIKWSSVPKWITPAGVIIMILLTGKFATKDEIQEINDSIVKINTSIALLVERELKNDIQDKKINDLQTKVQDIQVRLAEKGG